MGTARLPLQTPQAPSALLILFIALGQGLRLLGGRASRGPGVRGVRGVRVGALRPKLCTLLHPAACGPFPSLVPPSGRVLAPLRAEWGVLAPPVFGPLGDLAGGYSPACSPLGKVAYRLPEGP